MARLTFIAVLLALGAPVAGGAASAAPLAEHGGCAVPQSDFAPRLSRLINNNPYGGAGLTRSVRDLLRRYPGLIAEVVAAARQANRAQAQAIAQGVAEAHAAMKIVDPVGAQCLQAYLDANRTDPVVAQILAAEAALASNGGDNVAGAGGGPTGGGGGFAGGGSGFVSGGGGQVSPH